MTAQEFNKNYWCILTSNHGYRKPIGFPMLKCFLGVKFDRVISRLENCLDDKLVVKPNHGVSIIFYRH